MAQTIKLKRSGTAGAAPSTSDLALGEVAINTYDGKMFIKKSVSGSDSIVELGTGAGGEATYSKTTVTATNGQTTVSSLSYTAGLVEVYLNGARLVVGTDVTATNGNSIVLATGAAVNDIIQVVAFKASDAFSPTSPTFTGTTTSPIINASTTLQISGVAITSTASELNLLDGVSTTAAELNILDNATVTTAELNILDGVTATTAELNILDGVTATTTELNLLDGVTATTAELNYTDGVTSNIQTQIDGKAPGLHTIAFTANGAIAANKPVILESDGKVAQVAIADRTKTTTFDRATANFQDSGYDPYAANIVWDSGSTGMFVMCGKNRSLANGNFAGPRVGTVTGLGAAATITMGLEVAHIHSDECLVLNIVALDAGRFMFHYAKSNESTYRIGQIIGTGQSAKLLLGSPVYNIDCDATQANEFAAASLAYDPTVNKAVAVFATNSSGHSAIGNYLVAQVISIDGMSVSVSTAIGIDNEYASVDCKRNPSIAADPSTSGLYMVAWKGAPAVNYSGAFRQLKLSGTTLTTPSSEIGYLPDSAGYWTSGNKKNEGFSIAFNPTVARQFIIIESSEDGVRSWVSEIASVGGAFSTTNTFEPYSSTRTQITTDLCGTVGLAAIGHTASGQASKYIVSYSPRSGTDGGKVFQQIGTLSGEGNSTSMTWGTRQQIDDHLFVFASGTNSSQPRLAADPNVAGRVLGLIYEKITSPSTNGVFHVHLTEVGGVYSTTNLASNFVGISDASISNAASGNITVQGGVATGSGLTIGSTYYAQTDGTVTTSSAGTNIGKALTTTKILLKGL